MMEAMRSYETSVLIRATGGNIPEDGIHRSYRRENLKSYNVVPSSQIHSIFKMDAARSSETSILTRSHIL
jgi:hypothetical protein